MHTVCISAFFSRITASTSSFLICSVQLRFYPVFCISTFRNSPSSVLYLLFSRSISLIHTAQHSISVFLSFLFFRFLFSFPLGSSLVFENASFPIAILLLISLWHLGVAVIILLRYM